MKTHSQIIEEIFESKSNVVFVFMIFIKYEGGYTTLYMESDNGSELFGVTAIGVIDEAIRKDPMILNKNYVILNITKVVRDTIKKSEFRPGELVAP